MVELVEGIEFMSCVLPLVPRVRLTRVAIVALLLVFGSSASAQTTAAPPDPNPGNLTLTGSFDLVSTYMFRGLRQHSTGIALWPVADLGISVYSGDGGLGDTTKSFNGGDGSRVIGSIGLGFSY